MEKPQDLNKIHYHDIFSTLAYLKDMKEWYEALHFVNHFLDSKVVRNPQEIQACGEMFEVFYQNFGELLVEVDKVLYKMVEEKIYNN